MPYADWRRERIEWNGPEVLEREGKMEGEKVVVQQLFLC